MTNLAWSFLTAMCAALGMPEPIAGVVMPDGPSLPSAFAVSDLAQASVGTAGWALSNLVATARGTRPPSVHVDRELAAAWFSRSLQPVGWELPPVWDSVAGDYAGTDGWIRLHTNAPRHRAAALATLDVPEDRSAVAAAVAGWPIDDLETAVVAAGGAAARMRSLEEWSRHPQGCAVAREPLVHHQPTSPFAGPMGGMSPERPLAGIRVLDLTRVLAGPVATRLLAGWGAEVLRIDPPDWDEPAIAPEVTLGKHCSRLDLRNASGKRHFLDLLGSADVLVHGYRPEALDGLGLDQGVREDRRPGLVDVSLDAYGWSGPWRTRRGFDSLVQMSSGIADAGRMTATGSERPRPLPVQALDHATGYLLAAAALNGLTGRLTSGTGSLWRASLARTATLLVDAGPTADFGGEDGNPPPRSGAGPVEHTAWGDARRIPVPVQVEGSPLLWSLAARPLGSDPPRWD